MCGRTALTTSPADLREALGLDELPAWAAHYNVPPSQPVAVLRAVQGSSKRTLDPMRWGLLPAWAQDPTAGAKLALARAETVANLPAFRDAIRKRRCLVIVDGFYEWRREGKQRSQPYFIRRSDRAPFALAGVWDRWNGRDGVSIESCAILTQAARAPVDAIHDRMPVVLERETWNAWLDPNATRTEDFAAMLEPHTPTLIAFPVHPSVNDPRNDNPRCIEPHEPAQLRLI